MFKFNFNAETKDENGDETEKSGLTIKIWIFVAMSIKNVLFCVIWAEKAETNATITTGKYDECVEVFASEEQLQPNYSSSQLSLNVMTFDDNHKIFYISVGDIINDLIEESDDITCAEENHSDLVAGVYEGI